MTGREIGRGPKPAPGSRRKRRWRQREDLYLIRRWGHASVEVIAGWLGRTPDGVTNRAHVLELGSTRRGFWSLEDLIRKSGFARERVLNAAHVLGLKLERTVRSRRSQPHSNYRRPWAITEAQGQQVLDLLRRTPIDQRLTRSPKGSWGTGRKPKACVGTPGHPCRRTDLPHRAKGKCRICYYRERREERAAKRKR